MIRRRFPGVRIARIAGWTALATAWVAAGMGRLPAPSGAGVSPPTTTQPVETGAVAEAPAEAEPLPTMPEEGLVVLRYTPTPKPPPQTVERVVVRRVVTSSPPAVRSSGS